MVPVTSELLGRLIDQHAAALELYASQWCDCPEDVLQQVLIELARQEHSPTQLLPWLYRAIRYRAINARRAADRRRRHEAQMARDRPTSVVGEPTDNLDADAVTAALETLPNEQREVVVAHVWGGLTFQEIGRVTATSESTAHRRFTAALSAIRRKMGESCMKKK